MSLAEAGLAGREYVMGLEPPVEPIVNDSLGDFGDGASQRDGSVRTDFGGGLVLFQNGEETRSSSGAEVHNVFSAYPIGARALPC